MEAATVFKALTQTALADQASHTAATAAAHHALHQIAIIRDHCEGKDFTEISVDNCVESIRTAEGGESKVQLSQLIQEETTLTALVQQLPSADDYETLRNIANRRDQALSKTAGPLLCALYTAGRGVLEDDAWTNKNQCPACGYVHDGSLLEIMNEKLNEYEAVEATTNQLLTEWTTKQWPVLRTLESRFKRDSEPGLLAQTIVDQNHIPMEPELVALWTWTKALLERAAAEIDRVRVARADIQKTLPESMVAVTSAVEAARRLQATWKEMNESQLEKADVAKKIVKIRRVKSFLDEVEARFARAEGAASQRRLAAVEPLCQSFFDAIIHQPVKPALIKPSGGEELVLQLAQFFGLTSQIGVNRRPGATETASGPHSPQRAIILPFGGNGGHAGGLAAHVAARHAASSFACAAAT
jgi:hypothetical protein